MKKNIPKFYSGAFILKISVFKVNVIRPMKAAVDVTITLFAMPKLSIMKPHIKAPRGPAEKMAKEYIDKILPL